MRISVLHRSRILRSLRTCAPLSKLILAGSLVGGSLLAAQTPAASPSPTAPQAKPHHRAHSVAAHPSAVAAKAPPAAPPEPAPPNWPINDHPAPPTITWDSSGLRINAANSSLKQILGDVATATGARVEGFGSDERVFGEYGPGQLRDVLSQLLQGSGYNILMIGDQTQGAPLQIVLSARRSGSAPAMAGAPSQGQNDDDSAADSEVDDQPQPMPVPPAIRPGFGPGAPGGPVRAPQQVIEEMQRQQQQLQQVPPPNVPPNQ
jgi:vacuolar-type H+-ATPase subunit F/Vma7